MTEAEIFWFGFYRELVDRLDPKKFQKGVREILRLVKIYVGQFPNVCQKLKAYIEGSVKGRQAIRTAEITQDRIIEGRRNAL